MVVRWQSFGKNELGKYAQNPRGAYVQRIPAEVILRPGVLIWTKSAPLYHLRFPCFCGYLHPSESDNVDRRYDKIEHYSDRGSWGSHRTLGNLISSFLIILLNHAETLHRPKLISCTKVKHESMYPTFISIIGSLWLCKSERKKN